MDHSLIVNTLNELESLVASNSRLYLEGADAIFIQQESHLENLCYAMGEFPFEMISPRSILEVHSQVANQQHSEILFSLCHHCVRAAFALFPMCDRR